MNRWRRILALSKRDLKKLIKEKSFLFVILSQLIVISLTITAFNAYPDLFYSTTLPGNVASVAVVGEADCYRWLSENLNMQVEYTNETEKAFQALREQNHAAVIECEGFEINNTKEPIGITAYTGEGIQSRLILPRLKSTLKEQEKRIRNLRWEKTGEEKTFFLLPKKQTQGISTGILYSLLLPLFYFSTVVLAGNLFINIVSMEYAENTVETLLSTPMSKMDFLLSKSLTCVLPVPLQIGIWMFAFTQGGLPIQNFPLLIVLSIAYAMVFTSLSILAYHIARDRDTAQNILTIFLFMLFVFLLPLPVQLFELLGPGVNVIPIYLVSHLAFNSLSLETIMGTGATVIFSAAFFSIMHWFGKKKL